jgi:hypothetical protein
MISAVGNVRSRCSELSDFNSTGLCGLALEFFDHDLAVLGLDHDAIAFAHVSSRRHDDDVAVAVGGLHRVAGDFQGVGVLVVHRGEGDLLPALADRKAAVVEKSAGAGLCETDQRHAVHRRLAAVADQGHERVELSARRLKRLGDGFSRRPARTSFRGNALGLVEGRRVEAGLFRKA